MARKIQSIGSRKATQAALELRTEITALYVRVSTQSQADEGFSLEAQQERLEAYAKAQGWTIDQEHIYIDAGVSGKTTDRPRFKAMMHAAQTGTVQRIVAMKLDRMARNVREFLATVDQLKEWHCDLVLVKESFDTSTPHGRFALTMFAAMAELEASTITERVMSGKQQKAKEGGFNGAPAPYGYFYRNGVFVVHPGKAKIVKAIFQRFTEGATLLGITEWLNDARIPSPTGKQWSRQGIRHMLANAFYAGLAEWAEVKGEKAPQPAIVDCAVFESAAARIKTLNQRNTLSTKE